MAVLSGEDWVICRDCTTVVAKVTYLVEKMVERDAAVWREVRRHLRQHPKHQVLVVPSPLTAAGLR